MAVITTLDSLIERVLDEEGRKYDLLADTRRMSVELGRGREVDPRRGPAESGDRVVLHERPRARPDGDRPGVPKRYFDRMKVEAPDLFRTNVHHWLYEEPNRRMIRARACLRGRAGLTGQGMALRPLPPARQHRDRDEAPPGVRQPRHRGQSSTTRRSPTRSSTSGHCSPRWRRRVKVGDPVQWGVQIRNSEVGGGQFAISNFVMRLACIERHGREQGDERPPRRQAPRREPLRRGDPRRRQGVLAGCSGRAACLARRDAVRGGHRHPSGGRPTGRSHHASPSPPPSGSRRAFSLSEGEKEAVLLSLARAGT